MLRINSLFIVILLVFFPLTSFLEIPIKRENQIGVPLQSSEPAIDPTIMKKLLTDAPIGCRFATLSSSRDEDSLERLTIDSSQSDIKVPFTGFIQNLGQVPDDTIHYYYSTKGLSVGFGPSTITFVRTSSEASEPVRFEVSFPDAQLVSPEGQGKKPHSTNYFSTNQHFTNLPSWKDIWYADLYPGIDLHYYMSEQGLKYDFVVQPGADPAQIRVQISESMNLNIEDHMVSLQPRTHLGRVQFQDTGLQVFQADGPTVSARFRPITGHLNTYGFQVSSFDPTQALIIDPIWPLFNTYVGGDDSYGRKIAVDTASNVYVTGSTSDTDFPTVNAYDTTGDGSSTYDVFVFKLAANGSTLLYSTYVSGSNDDQACGFAVDAAGNAYITGETLSTDFPTVNAYDATGDGSTQFRDVFVFKLAANGSTLLYSTYVSGSQAERYDDVGLGIAIDAAGNAYVTGWTESTDFPTVNAYDATGDGSADEDVFIFKLSADGSNLLYSTYVSGSYRDLGTDIAIDGVGNMYVTGFTSSTDFPTVNAYDATGDGSTDYLDVFVFKLAANGSTLLYSTYVGGSQTEWCNDFGFRIAIDAAGNAYVTGWTESTDFPTVNAYDATGDGSSTYDVFVFKLAANGSTLLYSTYVSGSNDDQAYGFAVDAAGNAYITGGTLSTDFPTVNAYDATGDGSSTYDAFVFKLAANDSTLLYSTYVSGSQAERYDDVGLGIAIDAAGHVYLTGSSMSNAFVTKFSNQIDDADPIIALTSPANTSIQPAGSPIELTITDVLSGVDLVNISWDGGTNETLSSPYETNFPNESREHVLRVYVKDRAENWAFAKYVFTTSAPPDFLLVLLDTIFRIALIALPLIVIGGIVVVIWAKIRQKAEEEQERKDKLKRMI
ncbi:MAG: SBBP repeat-containing protein [Candidatus Hermodarchaeota archaeon]